MRVYVAGRTNNTEGVQRIQKACKVAGHTITHDWTTIVEEVGGAARDDVVTPERQRKFAEADLRGVREADLLIMTCSPGLCGTLIEVGAALALKKPVWIFGQPERHSVFWHMPNITRIINMPALNSRLLQMPKS